MKTWEMIKELTENPEKVFKNQYGEEIRAFPDNDLFFDGENGHNYISITDEWEEVKGPVTWKEAFEAGLNGKKIKPKGQSLSYNDFESIDYAIAYLAARPGYYKKIMLDDWYIED